ncbi:MAG TPA: BatD family protein, partial [Thermoanaerobaculia bacterium]|nr:BatD family protein [Thermoanaerobaculia bacterium]
MRRALLVLLVAVPAFANDLSVDRHSLRVGETVTITVSLEDAFASVDDIDVPVKNLALTPTPSVSSEFSWINGTVVRRKIFRFSARAEAPGRAQVGPVVIDLPDGQRETFAAVALQVFPDRAAESNDPVVVLRELLATGRDPFFVVAEVDKARAYVGEQVVVTWW